MKNKKEFEEDLKSNIEWLNKKKETKEKVDNLYKELGDKPSTPRLIFSYKNIEWTVEFNPENIPLEISINKRINKGKNDFFSAGRVTIPVQQLSNLIDVLKDVQDVFGDKE